MITAVDPDERLAATFGTHVARWSAQAGAAAAATALAQRAATMVSQATSDGHSCVRLDAILEAINAERGDAAALDLAALRDALGASKVVGSIETPGALPLILDDARLYLHRYFDYERRLARSLSERAAHTQTASMDRLAPNVIALLDRLFAASAEPGVPDWQKNAAITALLGRLTIISGGPGTGKTTTVVNILACLLEAEPECRIALAAPTGKAAARMTEVIQQRASHLPDGLREKLPTEASTIHRLLGSLPDGGFRHDATHPLPFDVLVIDEASMLDLALAVHLIEAVPADARIILLGDKDQLAAVESGAVFSELSAQPAFSAARLEALSTENAPKAAKTAAQSGQLDLFAAGPPAPPAMLEDSVIWLQRSYRFAADSAIGRLASDTNAGAAALVIERLQSPADASLRYLNESGSVPSAAAVQALFDGYAAYIETLRGQGTDPASVTAAFARFRILCAVRDGPWGVNAINQQLTRHFRRTLEHPLDPGLRSEWYPGRPVMVLRNDHVMKLFNGDIGIVLPDADGRLQVYFPGEAGEYRAIAPVRLPEHETAFAMTVHKSQGSEFDEILLVLPAEPNRVLTRELLYTAVTRARARLGIVANAGVVAATVEARTKRVSGLMARIESLRA